MKYNEGDFFFLLFMHEHLSSIYPSSQIYIWAVSKLHLLFLSLCLPRYQGTISPIALICHVWLCGQQKETAGGTYSSWVLSEQQLSLHLSKPPQFRYIVISQHQSYSLYTTTYYLLEQIWGLLISTSLFLLFLLVLQNPLCNCAEGQRHEDSI